VEPITSRRNPLVTRLRALHQPRGRQELASLLLEGTHLVQEVLAHRLEPTLVLATPDWLERHGALLADLPAATELRIASPEVVAAAATTRSPDGVLLVLPLAALPRAAASDAVPGFVLALDRIQDPGNLGTLLRTALAAGVEEVWLGEGADPGQPKVLRASSGACLGLPVLRLDRSALRQRLHQARRSGLQVVATVVPGPGAAMVVPYWQVDWLAPTVLLLGNEGAGLGPDLAAEADRLVTIPHSPEVESLNVAVAAAPVLLERWRRRSAP